MPITCSIIAIQYIHCIHFCNSAVLSLQSHGLEQKFYGWTQWGVYIIADLNIHIQTLKCINISMHQIFISWKLKYTSHPVLQMWKMWPCQVYVHFCEINLMKWKWHSSCIIKAIIKAMAAAVMACDLVVFLATPNDLEIPHLTWECVAELQIAVMTVQFNHFLPPLSLYPSNHHQSITLLILRGDVVGQSLKLYAVI